MTRFRHRDEAGFTVVFLAISLVAMLGAGAMALDLGQAYASRRQMQNAADAAALAGSRAVLKARGPVAPIFANAILNNAVHTTVLDVATRNSASPSDIQCSVIRADQSVIAPCSPAVGWALDITGGGPAGVKVTSAVTNGTAFGKVLNASSTTSRASAAAIVQPVIGSNGSPFIICGDPLVDGGYPILNPDKTINVTAALALGSVPIQSAQVSECGAGAAFDGKTVDSGVAFTVPAWIAGDNGNGNDHGIYDTVAGAMTCPPAGPFTNCDLVIPVADSGTGNGEAIYMHVVALTVWHITGDGTGNPKYWGTFKSTVESVTRGQGGTGACQLGQACIVKLVS